MRLTIVTLLLLFTAFSGFTQDVEMEATSIHQPANKQDQAQAEMIQFQQRIANQVAGSEATAIDLIIDPAAWKQTHDDLRDEWAVGLTEQVDYEVDLNAAYNVRTKRPIGLDFGAAQHNTLSFVWTGMIMVENSTGIRLHIKDLNLPEGAELFVYSDLGQSFGPYTAQGPNGTGDFWTDTLFAELVWLQLEMPRDIANTDLSFNIDQIGHFGENFRLGREFVNQARFGKACQGNSSEPLENCFKNAACYTSIDAVDDMKNSVAYLVYKKDSDGKWYICTGSLINGSGSTSSEPFLLTAGHCIDSSTEADSLESYFDYRNTNCQSDPDNNCSNAWSNRNKVSGADLMAAKNNSDGDYSLLKLSGFPSGTYVKMGWTTANKSDDDGEQFYRVHHPRGYQQQYSLHEVDTSLSICSNDDRPEFVYTRHIVGYTEGGSSGSPLSNSNSRIIATDTGRCADQTCVDSLQVRDSSFRAAFYDALSPYLKPTYTKVKSIIVTEEDLGNGIYRAKVQVQVVDQYNTPVSGALVQTSVIGPMPMPVLGVTGTDGWSTAYGIPSTISGTWTACPVMIVHGWLTYNPSKNNESCDSN